jgi:hypothetical protein
MPIRQVVTTSKTKGVLLKELSSLPARIVGRTNDPDGIATGLAARIGYTWLSLVSENLERRLSRGKPGDDGTTWPLLSQRYLAYGRRWSGRNKRHPDGRVTPLAGGLWPGGKDSFMNRKQLDQWWRTYRQVLAGLARNHTLPEAKTIAAKIATASYKRAGGETKLHSQRLGNRQVGVGYQILRDQGFLFNTLTPGTLSTQGSSATYSPPTQEQVFRREIGKVIIGTNRAWALAHHEGRGNLPRRRLWPERLPDFWMEDIRGAVISGLSELGRTVA